MHAARLSVLSKILLLIAKAGLTFLAFWYVAQFVDVPQIRIMLQTQSPVFLILAALFIALQFSAGAMRWRLIMKALSYHEALMAVVHTQKLYFIGAFFSTWLPGVIGGDVARAWMARQDSRSLSESIHAVVIDRLLALCALGFWITLTLGFYGRMFAAATVAGAGLFALGFWFIRHADDILKPYARRQPILWLMHFFHSLRLLMARRRLFVGALIYSFLSHALFCFAAFLLTQSLGLNLDLLTCFIVISPAMLAAALPVSFAGWGLREAVMVGVLPFAGIAPEAALTLSVQLGLLTTLVSLPGGFLWLAHRTAKTDKQHAAG